MIVVTERAVTELKNVLPRFAPDLDWSTGALRVLIAGECGCGKVHYGMDIAPEVRAEDTTFEVGGLRFTLEQRIAEMLNEAELDYESDMMHSGFRINNPNDAGCNCGH